MKRPKPILLALGVFLSAGVSAYAGSVTFDFNSLSSGANAASISTYMNGVLHTSCPTCSVTVLSSGSSGAVADTTYNGDGYVVGPGGKSLTLGTSNNATSNSSTLNSSYDTFIANTNDSSTQISQQITIQFTGLTLSTTSFDYEIFPDGSCQVLNAAGCGGAAVGGKYPDQPDLEFEAGTNTSGTDAAVSSFGTSGIQYGVTPVASGGTDGTSTTGPAGRSGAVVTVVAPQYIGTWSGSLTGLNANATELDFVDWPATIGIDNLQVSYTTTTAVPEPAGIVFLGTLVVLLTKKLRRI